MTTHIPKFRSGRNVLLFEPSKQSPTLQDAINALSADSNMPRVRRRDLISSLRRLASACGTPPAQVPSDVHWLRAKLEAQSSAARLAQTAKTRANILSNAVAALAHVGATARRPAISRSPTWEKLWCLLSPSAKIALGSFARFCCYHRIDPEAVSDKHVASFRLAILYSSLRKKPDDAIRELTLRWNAACDLDLSLHMQHVSIPQRRILISIPKELLPRSFRQDLEKYLRRLQGGDVLADDAVPTLAEKTITSRELQIRRFFGELVAAGIRPDDIPDLKAMVHSDMAYRGLKAMLERKGQVSGMIHNMAYALLIIAKHYTGASEAHLQKLRTFCKKVKPKRQGMTAKNRARLRQFDDPQALNRLLLLPDRLLREAESTALSPSRAAVFVEIALAIELFLMTALRVKNVARLNLDENIQWSRSSARGVCHLVVDGRLVKNGEDRDFELSGQTVRLLKLYIERYRSHLAPASCRWLFAKRDGSGPVDPVVLASRVSKAIRKRTGLVVNVHLFRSLGAKIYLDQNPGGYEVVRRALGHKHLSTTTAAYTGMENISAAKQFDLTLSKRRENAIGPNNSRSRSAA